MAARAEAKIFQPSLDGCVSTRFSNQAICASSMITSCDVYLASREPSSGEAASSVFSAIWRENCALGLPWMRQKASRCLLVRGELVDALEVVVAADLVVRPKLPRNSAAAAGRRAHEEPAVFSGSTD